jgi:hypothetical protein
MSWCIGASQSDGMDIGASGVFISDYPIVGGCSAEASMTGLATVNLVLIVGGCSAEANVYGLAVAAQSFSIVGSCSAEGSITGFAFVNVLPASGSCSAEASMSGTASATKFIIGICSAVASLTGLDTCFSYIVGSMSATASMSIWIVSTQWPPGRWSDYDEDLTWDEETSAWVTTVVGPSRYSIKLVVVGQGNANQGEIYFG